MDPGAVVSGADDSYEVRLARLVGRAQAERDALGAQFEPIRRIDTGLEWLARKRTQLPTVALGAGLGLSALLLALPSGRSSILRGGIALFQLAGSVKQLIARPRAADGGLVSRGETDAATRADPAPGSDTRARRRGDRS